MLKAALAGLEQGWAFSASSWVFMSLAWLWVDQQRPCNYLGADYWGIWGSLRVGSGTDPGNWELAPAGNRAAGITPITVMLLGE